MRIRHSNRDDLPRIRAIYQRARTFMAQQGNPGQWGDSWPPENLMESDACGENADYGYVCENDGQVVGVFFYKTGDDPTYAVIHDGAWLDDSPYGVVHRIATDGTVKGVGTFCLNWAFEQCGHLRIDTHADNVPMQNLLRKLGFAHCGTIYVFEDDAPRMAFEKSESFGCSEERNHPAQQLHS